jgi:glycerate kinase
VRVLRPSPERDACFLGGSRSSNNVVFGEGRSGNDSTLGSVSSVGAKYAHQYNKANAVAAERLTPEDIEASKPKTDKTRTVSKAKAAARSAK